MNKSTKMAKIRLYTIIVAQEWIELVLFQVPTRWPI